MADAPRAECGFMWTTDRGVLKNSIRRYFDVLTTACDKSPLRRRNLSTLAERACFRAMPRGAKADRGVSELQEMPADQPTGLFHICEHRRRVSRRLIDQNQVL